jgi:hypothetical protein
MLVAVMTMFSMHAEAAVTFQVQGTVDDVWGDFVGVFSLTDTFTLEYTFDETTSDSNSFPQYGRYSDPITSYSFSIGSFSDSNTAVSSYIGLDVPQLGNPTTEQYVASIFNGASPIDLSGAADPVVELQINLRSPTGVFADDSLPTDLTLSDFTKAKEWSFHAEGWFEPHGFELLGIVSGTVTSIVVVPSPAIAAEIDIKPGSDVNPVNPFSRGVIPVAILGTDTFDVAAVDETTLAFGPNRAEPAHKKGGHFQDVNDDGLTDLLSHYRTEETGIASGDTDECVTGETLGGIPFEGCDNISTQPPCGNGFAAALVLPPLVWIGGRHRRGRA